MCVCVCVCGGVGGGGGGGARGLVRGLVLLSIEAKIRKYNISLKLWLEVESFINNKTDLCQKN